MNYTDQFNDVLGQSEKVLWQDQPVFLPFVLSGLHFLIFGFFWAFIIRDELFQTLASIRTSNVSDISTLILILIPLWIGIGNVIRLFLVANNTGYAITNRRILMRSGFWGTDFKSVDYDKIRSAQVTVNPLEQIFGVGSIKLSTGVLDPHGNYYYDTSLTAIANPYEAFKKFQSSNSNLGVLNTKP